MIKLMQIVQAQKSSIPAPTLPLLETGPELGWILIAVSLSMSLNQNLPEIF